MIIFGGIHEVTKEVNDVCGFSLTQKRWIYLCEDIVSPIFKKR
jgi:hypothetical protein